MGETKRGETAACRRFSLIFTDVVLNLQGKWFGATENCRKPQETAGNRRKSQEAVSTPFSHLVPPIKRCPTIKIGGFNCE